ncbi:hypothetical protein IRJ41_000805, partial [Triplophysa rosa]
RIDKSSIAALRARTKKSIQIQLETFCRSDKGTIWQLDFNGAFKGHKEAESPLGVRLVVRPCPKGLGMNRYRGCRTSISETFVTLTSDREEPAVIIPILRWFRIQKWENIPNRSTVHAPQAWSRLLRKYSLIYLFFNPVTVQIAFDKFFKFKYKINNNNFNYIKTYTTLTS